MNWKKKIICVNQNRREFIILLISLTTLLFFFLLKSPSSFKISDGSNSPSKIFYFTTQSNILIFFFYLTNFFLKILKKKKWREKWNSYYIRGTITIYILITGIVFTAILLPHLIYELAINNNNSHKNTITNKKTISNYLYVFFVLIMPHIVVPTIVFYDFCNYLFTKKPKFIPSFFLFISYPYLYLFFTITLSPHYNNKYPYFFLNLHELPLIQFFAYIFGIFVFFVCLWLIMITVTRKKISKKYKKFYI